MKLRVAPEVRAQALEDARYSESTSAYISDLIMRPRRRTVPFQPGMELRDLVDVGRRIAMLNTKRPPQADSVARLRSALLELQARRLECLGRIECLDEEQFKIIDAVELQRSLVALGNAGQAVIGLLRALPEDHDRAGGLLDELRRKISVVLLEQRGPFDDEMNRVEQGSASGWRG